MFKSAMQMNVATDNLTSQCFYVKVCQIFGSVIHLFTKVGFNMYVIKIYIIHNMHQKHPIIKLKILNKSKIIINLHFFATF